MEHTSLSGRQTVLMDQRGRISFPTAYRAALGEVLYLSPDQGERNFLVVLSKEGYDAECEKIQAECRAQGYDWEDTMDELRDFSSNTANLSPDKNGRITIPADLISYAGFSGKIVVVGVMDHVELWDEERLAAHDALRKKLRAQRRAKKDAEKNARLAGNEA